MKDNSNTIKLSVYSSIYTDPIIGHHLSSRRDRCPGSLMVRAGVADALANRCFNPLHTSKENLYLHRFYQLGYTTALDYKPEDQAAAHRRGYEDYLAGLETLEISQAYLDGYHQAESDEIDYQRGQEEIYNHDLDNRPY